MNPLLTSIQKLEFDKILNRISQFAKSAPGKKSALNISLFDNKQAVELELRKVSESKDILITEGKSLLNSFQDISHSLRKLQIADQILSIPELIEIYNILVLSNNIKTYLTKNINTYPFLGNYKDRLFADKILEHHIIDTIDERGFVKDTASKELKEIRNMMISISEVIKNRLEGILKRVSEKEFLQEEIITTREGRLVIPVKVEYKNKVPGFIHSASSSGATVFIEPAETLDLNNQLCELQIKEKHEIIRILRLLTQEVRKSYEELAKSYFTLVELDVLFAKAYYSIEIMGNPPNITEKPSIKLLDARHPILISHLNRNEVVPLSVELNDKTNTIVITGPNAGGKTVALKTIGLMVLCTAAGIHIPASSNSEIFLFNNIFVDIGDDQSIENDLSSFSSHLNSLNIILKNADQNSLVLIDEIGTGTDPAEGGALAIAVLEELTRRKVITIATTHHSMIKVFAYQTPGISNASMEYDQASLKPTYHFRVGIPGSSYAFELAERIGFDKTLLNQARKYIGEEKNKLELLIIELNKQIQAYSNRLKELLLEKNKLESLVFSYEQKMLQLKREKDIIKKKSIEEAREIVQQSYKKIETIIKEIRESGANKAVIKSSHQTLSKIKQELKKMDVDENYENEDIKEIREHDKVTIRNGTEIFEVYRIMGEFAIIISGSSKIKVKKKYLKKIENEKQINDIYEKEVSFKPEAKYEVDVRGKYGNEALLEVQNFLDNAYSIGLKSVNIIHGKGTGSLRKKIKEFLKTYPYIKAYRLGEWNEGGDGVTIVELL